MNQAIEPFMNWKVQIILGSPSHRQNNISIPEQPIWQTTGIIVGSFGTSGKVRIALQESPPLHLIPHPTGATGKANSNETNNNLESERKNIIVQLDYIRMVHQSKKTILPCAK